MTPMIPRPSIPVIVFETAKPRAYPHGWCAVWSDIEERAAVFCDGVRVTDWGYGSTDAAQAVIDRTLAAPEREPVYCVVRTMPDEETVVTEFFRTNRHALAFTRTGDVDADVEVLV